MIDWAGYVVKGSALWSAAWRVKGWRSKGKLIPNADLWSLAVSLVQAWPFLAVMHVFSHVGVPGNEGADALASASLDQPIAGAQASTTGPVNHPNPANLPHAPYGADEFYCTSTAVGGGTPITYTDTVTTGAGGTSYCTA